jgi:hypothetical protein
MQGDQSLDGRQGKWFSGSALQYGVTMNPLCMSPKHARYARVLPQTSLHRIWNALLFNIVEPMLPPTSDAEPVDEPAEIGMAKLRLAVGHVDLTGRGFARIAPEQVDLQRNHAESEHGHDGRDDLRPSSI